VRSLLVLVLLAGSASADPVKVWQNKDSPAITEGETTLAGDPASLYATCLDYTKWNVIFPDVAKVIVTKQHGVEANVTLVTREGHRDNLHVRNQPAARMIYFEDTGNGHADVWAEIMFLPGDAEHTTKLHIRLFADVKGVASLVVSDTTVREQREQKVQRQLSHVRAYFAQTARN
jgi:hypothetical protein